MTEPVPEPARTTEQPLHRDGYGRPSRLGQVAATVAIVAGVVFVIAVVFFTGVFLGGYRAGDGDADGWGHPGQVGPGGKPGTCPMMGGDGMMGPGQMRPGGVMGPNPSATTTPSAPRP